jgi:hypothetical protein
MYLNRLVGSTTDREFTRCAVRVTLPRRFYLISCDYITYHSMSSVRSKVCALAMLRMMMWQPTLVGMNLY